MIHKNGYLIFFSVMILFGQHTLAQEPNWSAVFQGTGTIMPSGLIATNNGIVTTAGTFLKNIKIGEKSHTSIGSEDIFIAQYDRDGNIIFSKTAGGSSRDYCNDLVMDRNQNLYLIGKIEDEATFDNFKVKSNGDGDIFIAKYNSQGACEWVKTFGGTANDVGLRLAIDAADNIYCTGRFEGSISFDNIKLATLENADVFVAVLSPDGTVKRAMVLGEKKYHFSRSLAAQPSGEVFIGGSKIDLMASSGYGEKKFGFVAKFDPKSSKQWIQEFQSSEYSEVRDLSLDPSGQIVLTGVYKGDLKLNDQVVATSKGGDDIFVAKLTKDGNLEWIKSFGGKSQDDVQHLYLNDRGSFTITGSYQAVAFFDGKTSESTSGSDYFVAECGSDGTVKSLYVSPAGNKGDEVGMRFIETRGKAKYLLGKFDGTLPFTSETLKSQDGFSAFLLSFPGEEASDEITISGINLYNGVKPNPNYPQNFLNPGNTVRFKLEVQNSMPESILSGYGIVRSKTTDVTVIDSLLTFNNILKRSKASSVDEVEVEISSVITYGSRIDFELVVMQSFPPYGPWVIPFSLPVAPIRVVKVLLDDDEFADSYGNNNKIPEPGETIEALPLTSNMSRFTYYGVLGRLANNDRGIAIWKDTTGASGRVSNVWQYSDKEDETASEIDIRTEVLPHQDYVFTYQKGVTYNYLMFDMEFSGEINLGDLVTGASGRVKLRWNDRFEMKHQEE